MGFAIFLVVADGDLDISLVRELRPLGGEEVLNTAATTRFCKACAGTVLLAARLPTTLRDDATP
jgi:hypothetical protein